MKDRLTISIAMTTYNGERFLQEQLDSFLWQTRLPDELVVCDDGSTDNTVEILESFKKQASFHVKLFINEQNLGYGRNFEKALYLCQGDIISFSDQDDIWLPEKLKEVEQVFYKYPGTGFVFHDAQVVNENDKPLGFSLWDYYGSHYIKDTRRFSPGEFTTYCLKRIILGATMTLSAKLRDNLLPFPKDIPHDTWISIAGSLIMPVVALPRKLNRYRLHSKQVSGSPFTYKSKYKVARKMGRASFTESARRLKIILSRLLDDQRLKVSDDIVNQIMDKIEHIELRGSLSGSILRKLLIILKEVIKGRYHRHSSGWGSVARDLLGI